MMQKQKEAGNDEFLTAFRESQKGRRCNFAGAWSAARQLNDFNGGRADRVKACQQFMADGGLMEIAIVALLCYYCGQLKPRFGETEQKVLGKGHLLIDSLNQARQNEELPAWVRVCALLGWAALTRREWAALTQPERDLHLGPDGLPKVEVSLVLADTSLRHFVVDALMLHGPMMSGPEVRMAVEPLAKVMRQGIKSTRKLRVALKAVRRIGPRRFSDAECVTLSRALEERLVSLGDEALKKSVQEAIKALKRPGPQLGIFVPADKSA